MNQFFDQKLSIIVSELRCCKDFVKEAIMVAEAEVICEQSLVINYLCAPSPAPKLEPGFVDVSYAATVPTVAINSPTLRSPESLESIDFSRSESVCIESASFLELLIMGSCFCQED